ncbi:MAG TPA: type II toxin-antitoxin system prevent-host-death family antitoxin [Terriglobales bacterium]|nr:type II toxin-antitoxin system prevent-host-death family antitoxin [Terriglobales bacterium]
MGLGAKRNRRTRGRQPHRALTGREGGASYTATAAKNEFGRMLEQALRGETVVITKHQTPKAVLMSMEQFTALRRAPEAQLEALSREYDALLARMQSPRAAAQLSAAFHATPAQLGKAAVAAARKRG